jgi:cell division initiation protein
MSVITPKDLAGKSFSTAFKGYNKTEVDEYVSKVTKNYSALYRKCFEMEERLAVANIRLENYIKNERRAKEALESAKEKGDIVVAEAYEKADDILLTLKKNCDSILMDFQKKVTAQKNALAEMSIRVDYFKNEIFAKYKTHIESLEQIATAVQIDEDYSTNEYIASVINDLKYEISAIYDIDISYEAEGELTPEEALIRDAELDVMPTEDELSAFINELTQKEMPSETEETQVIALPSPEIYTPGEEEQQSLENIAEEISKTVIVPSNKKSHRKKKNQLRAAMDMLREFDEADIRNMPKIEAQLMLNLDDANDSLITAGK